MLTKPTNAYKRIKVSYIIDTVFLLHVSATLVAILREVCCKEWIYRDITKVCEQTHRYVGH
jgi:hypothetical protein